MTEVRLVVTGQDAACRSVFVSDELVPGDRYDLFAGWEFHPLWGGDGTPQLPDDGRHPAAATYFPAPGGFRFSLSTIPPDGTEPAADLDREAATAAVLAGMPGLLDHMEPDDPGMHTTDTIDMEVILSGEVILELDDGAKRRLGPGDAVVQNGTRHRWLNPGRVPCVMAVFMVGGRRHAR